MKFYVVAKISQSEGSRGLDLELFNMINSGTMACCHEQLPPTFASFPLPIHKNTHNHKPSSAINIHSHFDYQF